MTTTTSVSVPHIRWADRKSFIYLTVDVPDCKENDFQVKSTQFIFKTTTYEVEFSFFDAVLPEVIK